MSEFEYVYSLNEGSYIVENEAHTGYGITLRRVDESRLSSDIVSYYDISTNKEGVERLVLLCNELKLSPVHLEDVIEDFLG